MRVTGYPLQAIISEPRVWPRGDSIRGPQPNDMLNIQTHRLEKLVTKQQRSLKLSKENNSSARAKLSTPEAFHRASRVRTKLSAAIKG